MSIVDGGVVTDGDSTAAVAVPVVDAAPAVAVAVVEAVAAVDSCCCG